ncbi:chorismate synthase [Nitrosomonas oligotropha]|uniref:Chorismate synthase n=1 Tax=Nitrosomonas oligotropha TaxID=42354 RepID=A0A1H8SVF3_9PROT|nr:chorismate synthase [Nitrosomonas oligotropha]SDX18042.1 chorismate synthase [Nitrosomonas oligotropha]SEO82314.1 chorismate synthase [Nitrosomonas oligotropha]
MSGNTLGTLFTVTSFGESHGPAIGCIVDGCPPGLAISTEEIQLELDRRKPGTSRHVTQRRESDTVEILSGVFEGQTTGTPIALLIRNEDQRSKDYSKIMDTFRPGHADYTYWQKYGIRDYRGGGRASARETAVRVAAGAIAKKWLHEKYGIVIRGYMAQLGPIQIPFKQWDDVQQNPFFVADSSYTDQLETFMDQLRKSGDSVGAKISVVAQGVPVGWGEPVYDRLDAEIAYAMMNINAVKGVEIGAGFASVTQKGTEHSDEMTPDGFLSNNAGGILGGISTGQDIVAHVAIKPTSSIRLGRHSIDKNGAPVIVETHGRHDPCVGIRATPIVEAMLALVLMDHALRHRAQNADVNCKTPKIPASVNGASSAVPAAQAPCKEDPEPEEDM